MENAKKDQRPGLLQKFGIKSNRGADSHLTNVASKKARSGRLNNNKVEDAFDDISDELPQYVVGQDEFLEELVLVFKKSFLVENDNKSYRNMCIVIGPNGTGRNYAIKVLAKFLYIQKLTKDSAVYDLDCTSYSNQQDVDKLFYPDMYRAFYSDAPIVVLNHFDKACDEVIRNLETLGIEGRLKSNKRFGWNKGEFQENTGSYAEGLNDYISANNKCVILISDKSRSDITNMFKNVFFNHIDGVIETSALSDEPLQEIVQGFLLEYQRKVSNVSGKTLNFDSIILPLVKAYDKKTGVHFIEKVLESEIYKPLVELIMKGTVGQQSEIILTIDEDNRFRADGNELGQLKTSKNEEQLAEVKQELDKIIGLSNVKDFVLGLEETINFQRMRTGSEDTGFSLHMIFTGNPGTGKTTVARIVAKYLKALGILSDGHLVEVARNDLVGQYIGETAQKTKKVIDSAVGGVLFIDEAYALNVSAFGSNDQFGLEAINTLVKCMEDYRDNLVVIAAGYTKEMTDFLKANSGLQSRFNHTIEFPDYSASELLEITKSMAKGAGYSLKDECDQELLAYYEKKQIPGKNDSGNGRMARNILEKAISTHAHTVMEEGITDPIEMNTLGLVDFGLEKNEFDFESELSKVVGLNEVKGFIRNLNSQLEIEKKRREAGVEVSTKQSMNMLFLGNPGTGKTYVARLLAKILHNVGYLANDTFVETDRAGLVAEYAGQTATKTRKLFTSALGGVLFIDEAYSLSVSNQFDREAIDTLVKLIEDNAGNIVVILAGYKKEMGEFLNANSGLRSRFSITMNFEDYSVDELYIILAKQAQDRGFLLGENAEAPIRKVLTANSKKGAQNGNARMARNLLEEAIRRQTDRLSAISEHTKEDLITLMGEDFAPEQESSSFDLEAKLGEIIGLESVKDHIRSLYNLLKLEKAREELGIIGGQKQTLHMIFTGNPGTGKTTVARLVGEILYELGILSSKNFVETDRAGLVAGYVGQTALKTKEVIDQALDGVLFVDEAYALSSGGANDFGKEAIDTLVKDMDDNRERLVVILAGYTKDMEDFLLVNPGLKSRFPNIIAFPDYNPEELLSITQSMLSANKYVLSSEAKEKLLKLYQEASQRPAFGNGRFARNMCEKMIRNLSTRISKSTDFTVETLTTITAADVSED